MPIQNAWDTSNAYSASLRPGSCAVQASSVLGSVASYAGSAALAPMVLPPAPPAELPPGVSLSLIRLCVASASGPLDVVPRARMLLALRR